MNKAWQKQKILEHFKNGGSLTSVEALNLYGIARLGSRICELRKAGYDIRTVMQYGETKYGNPCHWARYWMEKGE